LYLKFSSGQLNSVISILEVIKIKKNLKNLFIVLPLTAFLVAYTSIPGQICVTKGHNLNLSWGMEADAPTDNIGRYDCRVKFLGVVPIKTVNVSVNPQQYVVPSGEAIGVRMYTDGVLVIATGSVRNENGVACEPAKMSGLEIGDRIVKINGEKIISTEDFTEKITACNGQALLDVVREDKSFQTRIAGVYSHKEKCYKLGIWVRDSTAGIGTLTFYNPSNSSFGALGHGICDSDTGDILVVRKGSINRCRIIDAVKGEKGTPGELIGSFCPEVLGEIDSNCSVGIFGSAKKISEADVVKVATRYQLKKGKAEVMCDVDGKGTKTYEIEITKPSMITSESNKDFVIKVTDKELLEKTGGIVQGMSGSPILQNGKLVGAVTHVFVNDPTKGYGIFIENMLAEAEKVK